MALVAEGRRALTRYRRLAAYTGLSLFEAELFTGRTHQIRVHFSAHGFPLAGDGVYTNAARAPRKAKEDGIRALAKKCAPAALLLDALAEKGRQFLHAAHLGFTHPATGKRLEFHSELPADLREIVLSLEPCKTK
jgi:23S rRNA pseudouridine1911/1915/1917 synthase